MREHSDQANVWVGKAELEQHWKETKELLSQIDGFLQLGEAEWLYRKAACEAAEGAIVEIGSLKGRSTVALARGAQARGGAQQIVAVDPHLVSAPAEKQSEVRRALQRELAANLALAGVSEIVDVRAQYSEEVAREWCAPVRLLWIDGDHTKRGVEADVAKWLPHLVEGGLLAMHDVLEDFEGPASVFLEQVLAGSGWTDIGFAGSIGFATRASSADVHAMPRTRHQRALLRRLMLLREARRRAARVSSWVFCRTRGRRLLARGAVRHLGRRDVKHRMQACSVLIALCRSELSRL